MLAVAEAFASFNSGFAGAAKLVVVCPKALIENWMEELRKWVPLNQTGAHHGFNFLGNVYAITHAVQIIPGQTARTIGEWASNKSGNGLLLISYTQLTLLGKRSDLPAKLIQETAWLVVADEAQEMGTLSSDVSQAMSLFKTPFKVGLTGTPMTNELKQLHILLKWQTPHNRRYEGQWDKFWAKFGDAQRGNYDGVPAELREEGKICGSGIEHETCPLYGPHNICVIAERAATKD